MTIHDPDMTLPTAGIDISKDTFDVHLQLPDKSTMRKKFANSESGIRAFFEWLASCAGAQVLVGIESTGPYGLALMCQLHEAGHQVALLNPRGVKDFAKSQGRRVKTDAVDAKVIADYVQALKPRLWSPPSLAISQLQTLIRAGISCRSTSTWLSAGQDALVHSYPQTPIPML